MEPRKPIRSFEDLFVWQLAIELVKQIYLITGTGLLKTDFALKDQLRRASISIPTNIAEGFERRSRKDYLQFLNIAKGSSGELRSLLRVSFDIGYLRSAEYDRLREAVSKVSACLFNQMKSLRASPERPKRT
jgi:four helix bundle protein